MEPGRLGGGSGTPFNDHCSTITVRPAQLRDAAAWLQLRRALWPEGSEAEHREDIDRFFAGDAREPLAVLLAEDGAGCPVGLAELSIRAYAEGCGSNRVAYLEGWFVVPKARRSGVGQALIVAEPWHATIHAALALGFGLWAQRLRQRPDRSELPARLEALEAELDTLQQQLSETQERLDFAERLLAKGPGTRRADPQR